MKKSELAARVADKLSVPKATADASVTVLFETIGEALAQGSLGVSRLDGREDEIRHFLTLGVSKSSIAKITGVTRPTLYNFIATRGLKTGA